MKGCSLRRTVSTLLPSTGRRGGTPGRTARGGTQHTSFEAPQKRNTAHSALEDGSPLGHSFATAVSSDGSGGAASVLETAQASPWSGAVLRHVLPFRIEGLTGGMQLVQQHWLRYGRFTTHCWNPLFGWSALLAPPSCPTVF